ncbi:hypothetical protein SAMD00019534_008510 [Acytostelium subglobosum LB1]|uniref:hypothetical protein n=1 Tax=Acytostelium subglobosum LB1 TaxID=1410327 RepID=UPI000645049C|nr:hypothetical protein SAMD00019534_008510 [Acytostelium subglobosum LB1]GAM17676.1 hypothetical protein SAMD00019534_008510 [Acytostelium subglobosum LB1]|eukprot:XP_012758272.1 hypothetical protein SAMD00019534_008510 [Acytostelium subglobosum LB1]
MVKYSDHTRSTFDLAISQIALEPEGGPMDGQNKFDRVIQLRRAIIPAVFDFVAMWSRMDGSVFPSGSYSEPVRKLYSPSAGYLVDWKLIRLNLGKLFFPKEINYQRMEEMFQSAHFEQYIRQIIQIKFLHDTRYLVAIHRTMRNNPVGKTDTEWSRVGTIYHGISTFVISPSIIDQNITLIRTALPEVVESTNPGCKFSLSFDGVQFQKGSQPVGLTGQQTKVM